MSESDRPSRRANILIVADDDSTATDLQTELLHAGYGVRRAESANAAQVALDQARTDLILMSLMLPDANGLILCATLKTQFSTPIIILGSSAGEVDRALALESGALDLLTKPVDVAALLRQVQAAVQTPVSAHH